MKPYLAFSVFLALLISSFAAGIDSLLRTERRAQQDVDHALSLTLRQCSADRIDADTIRVYRSLITCAAVRDTAYLSVAVTDDDRRQQPTLKAKTGLTFSRLWSLSDQRASSVLASLAALWLAGSLWWMRRQQQVLPLPTMQLGLLCYDENRQRFTAGGEDVHFTPMQQTLMELFWQAPDHLLMQQDICDRLWPKKPDASATLYTLIRRLKPTLDQVAGVNVECDRGRSYRLTAK
ncbi:MAG: helix-turn-helix domain-containing protein [Bacteroidaceae bacterium]|nr:helix-turn-helix domain-containing protein [Bacteroidaceae bacterium]